MRKFLSLLMVALCTMGAWAGEVTLTASSDMLDGTIEGFTFSAQKNNGSTAPAYNANGADVRIYAKGSLSITNTTGNNITKVVFNISAAGLKRLAPITASDGTIATQASGDETVTWTGEASTVTFTVGDVATYGTESSKAGQLDFSSVVITYSDGAVAVVPPVITGTTPFIGSTEVTITCDTENTAIYYTTDGSEPTSQSTEYTAPFTLTESATVKAIAYDATGASSAVASKDFVATPTAATVAEVYSKFNDGDQFAFTGRLVVSAQDTNSGNLYAQDETGGLLIYGKQVPTYKLGDVIPAGFTVTYTADWKGAPEVKFPTGMQAATENVELAPVEVTFADLNTEAVNKELVFQYAVIKNATVSGGNIVEGDEKVVLFNRFGFTVNAEEGKTYNITGVTGWYNVSQFMPLAAEEYVEPAVESFVSYVAEQTGGTVAVTLEDGTPVESLVTKVAEGTKVTFTATAADRYVITGYEVKAGEIVVKLDDNEYDGEFGAPALKAEGTKTETHTFTMPAQDVAINVTFEVATGISTVAADTVKSIRYYNAAGVESAAPFQGVNIVVKEMNDGTRSVSKMVK